MHLPAASESVVCFMLYDGEEAGRDSSSRCRVHTLWKRDEEQGQRKSSSFPRATTPKKDKRRSMPTKAHHRRVSACNACASSTDGQTWSDRGADCDSRPQHLFSGSKISILRCQGLHSNSTNEVLYLPTQGEDTRGNVVLFPGDVQDLYHRMLSIGHEEFSAYCLESTAKLMATKFPGHAVWVVLPKAHVHGGLASYDNFVKTDWASGGAVLEYLPDGSASEHLEALLDAAADAVQSLRQQSGTCCATTLERPDVSLPLTLVGFSKGSVVLNQLVTELACEASPDAMPPRTEAARHSSKRSDSRDDSDGALVTNNRKRSRVTEKNSSPGNENGGDFANSEGGVTNPPSPAEDADDACTSWPMLWESRQDGGDEVEEGGRTGGIPREKAQGGNTSRQGNTGSMWSRLWNGLGMSRFSTRPAASTSAASTPYASSAGPRPSTGESQLDGEELVDGRAGEDMWNGDRPGKHPGAVHSNRNPDCSIPTAVPASGTCDGHTKKSAGRRGRRKRSASASASTFTSAPIYVAALEQEDGTCAPSSGSSIARKSRSGRCCERNTDGAAQRLFHRVAAIHWVDGGNGGVAGGSFPSNLCSLARLAALPNLAIRVHGTPYQWGNLCRPWLVYEAANFVSSVEGFRRTLHPFATSPEARVLPLSQCATSGNVGGNTGVDGGVETASGEAGGENSEGGRHGAKHVPRACDVKRLLYFESEQPSLENHFRVLAELLTD